MVQLKLLRVFIHIQSCKEQQHCLKPENIHGWGVVEPSFFGCQGNWNSSTAFSRRGQAEKVELGVIRLVIFGIEIISMLPVFEFDFSLSKVYCEAEIC
jgi:hypothetical protein